MSDTQANALSLDDRVTALRKALAEVDKRDQHANDARLDAGRCLILVREDINALYQANRRVSWQAWCRENIPDRSDRDIRRLIKMANAADPEAARETEKTEARERMQRVRTNVRPVRGDIDPTLGMVPGNPK